MGDADVVEYQVPRPDIPWLRWVWAAAVVLGILTMVLNWFTKHRIAWPTIGWMVIAACWFAYQRATAGRPRRLTADADAIHLPRPLRDIPWRDVDHVKTPGRWDDTVVLMLSDGSETRTLFPPEYAERLAAVGNKPLR